MQASDKAEFVKLLTSVMAYYRQDCTEFLIQAWTQGMQPYALEQIRKAFNAHAVDPDRGQFAPKIADITRQLGGTSSDKAQLAWGKAYEAMSRIGSYTDVVFDDPAIHAVIEDLGGWPKICRTEADELSYLQHRFMQGYRSYAQQGAALRYPRILMSDRSPDGEFEKRGMKPPKPALIGDVQQARKVYELGGESKAQVSFESLRDLAIEATSLKQLRAA